MSRLEPWQKKNAPTALCYASCPDSASTGYGWTYQEWDMEMGLWRFRCVGMGGGMRNVDQLRRGACANSRKGIPCRYLHVDRWSRCKKGWKPIKTFVVGPVLCEVSAKPRCYELRSYKKGR